MRRWTAMYTLSAFLLGTSLVVAGAANATDGETSDEAVEEGITAAPSPTNGTVVYAGRTPSPEAAGDATALASLLGLPALPDGPLHVTQVVPAEGIRVLGGDQVHRCTGDPTDGAAYQDLLDDLYEATMSLLNTSSIADEIKRSQACAAEPLVPADIAYVSFMQALSEHSEGNLSAAEAAFREVFAVDAAYPWDPTFNPDAQLLFADVMLAVLGAETATLRMGVVPGTAVWLDGVPIPDVSAEVSIRPGRHLVQLRVTPDTPAAGVSFHVPAGEWAVVLDPVTLDAQSPADLERAATLLFASLQASGQPSPTHLLLLGDSPAAWSWDVDAGKLVPLDLPARLAGRGRATAGGGKGVPRGVGPVLAGVGGALLVTGAVLSGVSSGKLGTMSTSIEAGEMPFARPDDDGATGEMADNRATWDRLQGSMRAGAGLMIGGGLTVGVAIPLGMAGRNREHEVSLSARWTPATPLPDAAMPFDERFFLAITIR